MLSQKREKGLEISEQVMYNRQKGRADKVCPVEKWGDKAQATWLDEQNRRNDAKQCVYKYAAYCCLYKHRGWHCDFYLAAGAALFPVAECVCAAVLSVDAPLISKCGNFPICIMRKVHA